MPTPTLEPTPAGEVPVCADDLARILDDSENKFTPGRNLENLYTLVTYVVSGDTISSPTIEKGVPGSVTFDQQDTSTQEKIWQFVTDVVPADQRTELAHFVIYTDGANNSLGAVDQTDDPHYWNLEIDIRDARNFPDLATTVIHELAHLITLNDTQVTTDYKVFYSPDNKDVFSQEAATCSTYFIFEGCSHQDSYINSFFNQFWPDIYPEWKTIDAETDPDTLSAKLDSFYQEYSDQFVSDYAATNPEEDIAESFMFFVFAPKPAGATISEQKILFFYKYPELVRLRDRLTANLCNHLSMP